MSGPRRPRNNRQRVEDYYGVHDTGMGSRPAPAAPSAPPTVPPAGPPQGQAPQGPPQAPRRPRVIPPPEVQVAAKEAARAAAGAPPAAPGTPGRGPASSDPLAGLAAPSFPQPGSPAPDSPRTKPDPLTDPLTSETFQGVQPASDTFDAGVVGGYGYSASTGPQTASNTSATTFDGSFDQFAPPRFEPPRFEPRADGTWTDPAPAHEDGTETYEATFEAHPESDTLDEPDESYIDVEVVDVEIHEADTAGVQEYPTETDAADDALPTDATETAEATETVTEEPSATDVPTADVPTPEPSTPEPFGPDTEAPDTDVSDAEARDPEDPEVHDADLPEDVSAAREHDVVIESDAETDAPAPVLDDADPVDPESAADPDDAPEVLADDAASSIDDSATPDAAPAEAEDDAETPEEDEAAPTFRGPLALDPYPYTTIDETYVDPETLEHLQAHEPKEPGDMTEFNESLHEAMTIDGALGVALVDAQSGMALATAGDPADFNLEIAAAGNSALVQAMGRTLGDLDLDDHIEDILITLGSQYQIIRPINQGTDDLFLYLVLDRSRANLAMARFRLTKLAEQIEV